MLIEDQTYATLDCWSESTHALSETGSPITSELHMDLKATVCHTHPWVASAPAHEQRDMEEEQAVEQEESIIGAIKRETEKMQMDTMEA